MNIVGNVGNGLIEHLCNKCNSLPDATDTPAPVRATIDLHLEERIKFAIPFRSLGATIILSIYNYFAFRVVVVFTVSIGSVDVLLVNAQEKREPSHRRHFATCMRPTN